MNGVIYARYSSEGQREESIEGQIRECTEYCDKNGIINSDFHGCFRLSAAYSKTTR